MSRRIIVLMIVVTLGTAGCASYREVVELRSQIDTIKGDMVKLQTEVPAVRTESAQAAPQARAAAAAAQQAVAEAKAAANAAIAVSDRSDRMFQKSLKEVAGDGSEEIPEFPWPPPRPSAKVILPRNAFEAIGTLGGVDQKITNALEALGYFDRDYYAIRDGFALATRIEKIKSSGESMPLPDRWSADVNPQDNINMKEFLRRLFVAERGFYRLIVFVVSPHPITSSKRALTRKEAEEWFSGGADTLPESLARRPVTAAYHCTALIYEFQQRSESARAELKVPGILQGREHLVRAGLWSKFSE